LILMAAALAATATLAVGFASPAGAYGGGAGHDMWQAGISGTTQTLTLSNADSGITAIPGHYSTSDVLGFTAPGVSFQEQVTSRPAQ